MRDQLTLCSLSHVARFALVASFLYLLWCHVAPAYTATLMAPANWLLQADQLPAALAQRGQVTVMSWPQPDGAVRHLQIGGDGAAYLNMVAALTLALAIPGLSLRRRLGWVAGVAVALWVTHACILYGGAYSALGGHLSSLSPAGRDALLAGPLGGLLPDRAARLGHAVGIWTTWVSPAALILVWILCTSANVRRST